MNRPDLRLGLAALLAIAVLAGCECGPGIVCKSDAQCGVGGRCELLGASKGHCVALDGGGTPKILTSADTLDFPAVPCGKTVGIGLEVFNIGGGQLTFAASTGNSTFFSVSGGGSLDGGNSTTLAVSAAAPSASTAGAEQSGTLTLTSNDPHRQKIELPLTMKASGVTLALTPGSAPFGSYPVNASAPNVDLTLTNNGNVPATVVFGQPLDDQFSLRWGGFPIAVTLDPGKSSTGLVAKFTPHRIMPTSTVAAISVTEETCGSSVTSIPMSGGGINGELGFSSTSLSFGRVSCGTSAGPQTLTLKNNGNASLNWTGALAKSPSPFSVSLSDGGALGGSLTMGATADLTVTPLMIPASATTATDGFGDTLTIFTDVPNDTSHPVNLRQTASGAVLSFASGTIDFGMVPVNNTANAPLGVVNNGNAAATVTLVSSSDKFRVSPAAPAPVDGGVSNMLTAFFTPDASFLPDGGVRTENGTLAMNVGLTDVLCAALPPAMTMTGTGTTGSVSYTPAALSFGSVDCGQTAAPKQVTFSNLGTQSYQILSATLGGKADGGFSFSVAMSPASGVAASDGGTVVLTVTPLSIPQTSDVTANLYGDTLTVTTDVLGDSPHSVALDETAHGAIFGISANSLNFGFVVVGGTSTATFTISNSGNVAGTITITPASPTIFALPQNAVIDANSAAMQSATFHPLAPATYSDTGTISLSPSTVLCKPLPFSTIALSGQGSSSNVVVLSPTDLNFGLVKCGTTAGAKTIIVTNNSSQTLTFTLTLGAGAALFSASGLSTLTQGASGMITVTAKPVPARASTAPDAFTDTLSIRAVGAPVDETHIVGLHQTAEGAILTFNPSAINFNGSGSRNFTVNNAGNLTATFTLTEAGANFSVNPTGGSVNAGASAQETATYNRPPLGLGNKTATVSITSATTQCETLPPALTMIGN